jgi:hypothetical protein
MKCSCPCLCVAFQLEDVPQIHNMCIYIYIRATFDAEREVGFGWRGLKEYL